MSLAAALGEASPPSSGRSSPVPRATRRAVEDGIYKSNKALKRYATTVERALATWEISPEEWADYIAFLGRLLKAVQTHPKDAPILPQSGAIATRLAQCLNPALPSGVHQKALEVYSYIFSSFGDEYISGHLHEFLPGLSAVLSFASLSVRPGLYSLFEDHVVKLPTVELRPALKSLILSMLPALEEENSEDFERACNILHTLETSFTPRRDGDDLTKEMDGYFWQCFFLAVITSPSRRQGALSYLTRRLPKLPPGGHGNSAQKSTKLTREAQCIVSPEPGLLVRCFVCGLSDPQVLVQRGFLDLLVTHMPLSSIVLQEKIGTDDLDRLVSAAISVLMRRDMSLNRRLWTWFLGPEPKDSAGGGGQLSSPDAARKSSAPSEENSQLHYFTNFGKSSLQRCILKMLQKPVSEPSEKARPFRICLSLMDRWEIGGLIISRIFFPAMRALFEYSLTAPPQDVTEVVRSASLFFDGVEASLIWECLLGILHDIMERGQSPEHAMKLFKWIVQTFNVTDEEMLTLHIPYAVLYLVSSLGLSQLTPFVQQEILASAILLVDMLPPRVFVDRKPIDSAKHNAAIDQDWQIVRSQILDFYRTDEQNLDRVTLPFANSTTLLLSIKASVAVFSSSLAASNADIFPKAATLLLSLTSKLEDPAKFDDQTLLDTLSRTFDPAVALKQLPFPVLQSVVSLFSTMAARRSTLISADYIWQLEPALTAMLWHYLSPQSPKYHVEAVKAFWQLEQIGSTDDGIIATLAELVGGHTKLAAASCPSSTERYRRFMTLWTHSIPTGNARVGPGRRSSGTSALTDAKRIQRALDVLEPSLWLVLDTLNDHEDGVFDLLKAWINSLGSLESIFAALFANAIRLIASDSTIRETRTHQQERRKRDNIKEMDYYLSHFQNILNHGSQWTWRCLSRTLVPDSEQAEKDGVVLLCELGARMLFTDFNATRELNRRIIAVLDLLLSGPAALDLRPLELDRVLLERLMVCITTNQHVLQGGLLRLVQLSLKLRLAHDAAESSAESQGRASLTFKRPSIALNSRPTTSGSAVGPNSAQPPQLWKCLIIGFSSPHTRFYLEQWLSFLSDILPTFADAIFTNLLPLVGCLCKELSKVHHEMVMLSQRSAGESATVPEAVAMGLLHGLEMILDKAYDCLISEAANDPAPKESESKPSFLSNVTSGVFRAEGPPARTAKSNNRLTVILALQDSIRTSMKMWLWASSSTDTGDFDSRSAATTAYHALKVRNKTRHLLEQIFAAELLESLEVIIARWRDASDDAAAVAALSLLHVMQATKPKNVVPAIIDVLCSRTNPGAIPSTRQSSLTIDLTPSQVASFFAAYLGSTEDDAMDELWPDCITFLRDVLANPLPYRQVLPHLLSIMLLLSEKLSNTNFGEQRKMRRDLGDIFQRLLTATFTTQPSSHSADNSAGEELTNGNKAMMRADRIERSMTFVPVLYRIISKVDLLLETPERAIASINTITTSLVSPTFRARSFPRNIDNEFLSLVLEMARKASISRYWKKEVSDAFHDPKLLQSTPELMTVGWFPLLHQWSLQDKERIPELLFRLTPPSSAGIMFGVGASAQRIEADRRTQFTVRRICLLLLASPEDTYVAHLRALEEKLAELFEASPASSPSSAIKADLFLLCRTLALSVSQMNLAPLWPIINDNLQAALTSLLPNPDNTPKEISYNNLSLLQACKLLDTLLILSPDEFQLHEWLYITDTIDAVYQPGDWGSAALSDQVAEVLGADSSGDVGDAASMMPTLQTTSTAAAAAAAAATGRKKLPLLGDDLGIDRDDIKALPREEFVRSVVRPFLSQLSIHAYEGVYSLEAVDEEGLRAGVLGDVLDAGSMVE